MPINTTSPPTMNAITLLISSKILNIFLIFHFGLIYIIQKA